MKLNFRTNGMLWIHVHLWNCLKSNRKFVAFLYYEYSFSVAFFNLAFIATTSSLRLAI